MPSGIILKGIGGFYYVLAEGAIHECKARGIFRKDGITPLPGDRVTISINAGKTTGNIDEILPRDIILVRPAVTNVNQVVVTISARSPVPDLLLLDKLLLTAAKEKLTAVVCINKIDLDENSEFTAIADSYRNAGYTVITTSSRTGEGQEELRETLKGKITVFSGQSGVGKSTLINNIMESCVMKTGMISDRSDRGKHTTRHAELIPLEGGGFLADTPGFSSFELAAMEPSILKTLYPEFARYEEDCRFSGCAHVNEPDCAVKAAVESGDISRDRYL
ncbi:MAG: ribosome small subunit-dependent GTPase A, partial [Clostridiales bacterium]|nr:ribosome small subunit-dependent GTPase A [Clostridiales bacterium]